MVLTIHFATKGLKHNTIIIYKLLLYFYNQLYNSTIYDIHYILILLSLHLPAIYYHTVYDFFSKSFRYPYPGGQLNHEWVNFQERLLGFIFFDTSTPVVRQLVFTYAESYINHMKLMTLGKAVISYI